LTKRPEVRGVFFAFKLAFKRARAIFSVALRSGSIAQQRTGQGGRTACFGIILLKIVHLSCGRCLCEKPQYVVVYLVLIAELLWIGFKFLSSFSFRLARYLIRKLEKKSFALQNVLQ